VDWERTASQGNAKEHISRAYKYSAHGIDRSMVGDVEGLAAVRASSVCKETPKNVSKMHYSKNGDDGYTACS
jgi:hypothetical protein